MAILIKPACRDPLPWPRPKYLFKRFISTHSTDSYEQRDTLDKNGRRFLVTGSRQYEPVSMILPFNKFCLCGEHVRVGKRTSAGGTARAETGIPTAVRCDLIYTYRERTLVRNELLTTHKASRSCRKWHLRSVETPLRGKPLCEDSIETQQHVSTIIHSLLPQRL